MRHASFLLFLILISEISYSQNVRNPIYLEGGLTLNFLYKTSQPYAGSLSSVTVYDVGNLKPLPGVTFGIVSHSKISDVTFLRFGGLLSYHVNSLSLSSSTTDTIYGVTDKKENIKTRFQNLYIQLPVEIGFSPGEKKIFSFYGGLKLGYRVLNKSNWNYSHTTYNYEWSGEPVLVDSIGPTNETQELTTKSSDVAVEIGFIQRLSSQFVIEERVDASLFSMMDFGSTVYAPKLNQVTAEIVLGYKLH